MDRLKNKQHYSTSFHKLLTLLAFLMMAVITTNVHANNIKIHVHDAHKARPLKGISVCLGTAGNYNQFGAVRTDAKGNAFFTRTLPNTPVLLTVSGAQYKGLQRLLPSGDIDLVRTIDLPLGGLGPVCDAPPVMVEVRSNSSNNNRLRITGVNIDRGQNNTRSRSIVLSPNIYGEPTHYRISEDPEFKDSDWLEYQKTPLFTLSNGDGRKRVYYQVRRAVEIDTGTIQTTSNIASDWITLKSK